jgi:hypothetical protein
MGSSINFKVKGSVVACFSSKGRNFLKLQEEESGESQEFFAQLGKGLDLVPKGSIVTLEGYTYASSGISIVTSVMIHVSESPGQLLPSEGRIVAVSDNGTRVGLLISLFEGEELIDDDVIVDEDGRVSNPTVTSGYQRMKKLQSEPVWFNLYRNRFPQISLNKGDEIYFRASDKGNIFEVEIISKATKVYKKAQKPEIPHQSRQDLISASDSATLATCLATSQVALEAEIKSLRETLSLTASNLEAVLLSAEKTEKVVFGLRAENLLLRKQLNDAVKTAEFLQEAHLPDMGAETLFDDPSGEVGVFSPHSQGRLGAHGTIDSSWDEEEELPF